MAIGSYRLLVTVQVPGTPTPDGDGGYVDTWVDGDPPTWAVSIEPATRATGETLIAGTVLATPTHLVRGRYHASVTTHARLCFETRVFNVLTVRNQDERNRTLELVCAEVA